MNYTELQTTAYTYADRTDQETIDRYDDFLRIVEAKINRVLKTLKMSQRTTIIMGDINGDELDYYGLPPDFLGMRDLRINGVNEAGEGTTVTAQYRTPAQINEMANNVQTSGESYYSVIGEQLHIHPARDDTATMEMHYYQKLLPLDDTINVTNWVSDEHPDCYIYGIITEISAFVKDAEAAALWQNRFDGALNEIINHDVDVRWGNSDILQIRTL